MPIAILISDIYPLSLVCLHLSLTLTYPLKKNKRWPTHELWEFVSREVDDHFKRTRTANVDIDIDTDISTSTSTEIESYTDSTTNSKGYIISNATTTTTAAAAAAANRRMDLDADGGRMWGPQIGAHFRCGDISFQHTGKM